MCRVTGRRSCADEGTLYPLLRRLETQGLLVSEWREEEKRNKRFYRLSPEGVPILRQLLREWRSINSSLDRILTSVQEETEDDTNLLTAGVRDPAKYTSLLSIVNQVFFYCFVVGLVIVGFQFAWDCFKQFQNPASRSGVQRAPADCKL